MQARNPEPETGWAGRFHIEEIKEGLEWGMKSLGLPEDPVVTIENTVNNGERLKVQVWVDVKISDY